MCFEEGGRTDEKSLGREEPLPKSFGSDFASLVF